MVYEDVKSSLMEEENPIEEEDSDMDAKVAVTAYLKGKSKAPLPPKPDQDRELVIMVAGDSGLGKSTFINSLFDQQVIKGRAINEPTLKVEEHHYVYGDDDNKVRLTVIDTPGWGDHMNIEESMQIVLEPLEQRMKNFKLSETEPGADCRVQMVFYFIAPHRLKQVDLICMKTLQHYTTVIPVLAKADAMTVRELEEFRELVQNQIKDACIDLVPLKGKVLPFAVIGGKTREYAWGTADAENEKHSDLPLIKKMICSDDFFMIRKRTIAKYEQFMQENTFLVEKWKLMKSLWLKHKTLMWYVLLSLPVLLFCWYIVSLAVVHSGGESISCISSIELQGLHKLLDEKVAEVSALQINLKETTDKLQDHTQLSSDLSLQKSELFAISSELGALSENLKECQETGDSLSKRLQECEMNSTACITQEHELIALKDRLNICSKSVHSLSEHVQQQSCGPISLAAFGFSAVVLLFSLFFRRK